MMLTAYRLSLRQYASRAFLGEGARKAGGRWNPRGTSAVYTSATLSLAALEFLVHFSGPQDAPELASFSIRFDSKLVSELELPQHWRRLKRVETRALGRAWLEANHTPILRVPSFVIPTENNFVLNPGHPKFGKVKIEGPKEFVLDERLY